MTEQFINLVDMLRKKADNKYEIGEEEIVEALVNYPNILGWAIGLLKETSDLHDTAELDYNIWHKEKYNRFRITLETGKGKSYKIGKDDVEASIIADNKEEYRKNKQAYLDAKSNYDTARRILRSVEKIDNTLSNIAYQVRAEMKSFSVEKKTEYRLKKMEESKKEVIEKKRQQLT